LSEPTSGSKDVFAGQPVNQARAKLYERLMEAQERIAHACYRRGVDHEVVLAALDRVDEVMSDAERRQDLYLSALEYYVQALGGRLEVRAVFDDEEIVVRRGRDWTGS
jgi:hypothetical protein